MQLWCWEQSKLLLIIIIIISLPVDTKLNRKERREGRRSCEGSLKTVRRGMSCPYDKITWEERVNEFQCAEVNQNCTEKANFKYHCVLNEWGNRSVEVCAPETDIIGFVCAEFNMGGKFIQEHYRTAVKCKSCPFFYKSTEAYKYKECFMNILLDDVQSTLRPNYDNVSVTTSAPTPDGQSENWTTRIIIMILFITLLTVNACIGLLIYTNRKRSATRRFQRKCSRNLYTIEHTDGFVPFIS